VMWLSGSGRLRVRTGTLAVCALAFAGGSVKGAAQNAGPPPDLVPPFMLGYHTETSSLVVPCQEVPNPPGGGAASDPAAGTVHLEMAAEAQGCTSLAHDVSEVWALGSAPESLVGKRAHVTVVFVPAAFDTHGEGDATVGGGVFLSVGGSEEWPLGSFRCSAGACTPAGPQAQDGRIVLESTIEMLPPQVEAEYRAEAFVKRGTGKANVSLSGRLDSVTFGPAEDGQTGP
jgi:hypothetical protein